MNIEENLIRLDMSKDDALKVIENSNYKEQKARAAKGILSCRIEKGYTPIQALTYTLEAALGVKHLGV